jgi:hypothetical protein
MKIGWRTVVTGLVLMLVLAWAIWQFALEPRRERSLQIAPADTTSTGYRSVRLYFAAATGDSLVTESREMAETRDVHEQVAALVGELDRGPSGNGVAALPPGTSVLHAYLDDRGLMTLDLSRAFQQGFRGGSCAENLAVQSLARTIAANLPEVRRILFVCGGAPLPTLGGHVPLDRPIDVAEMP